MANSWNWKALAVTLGIFLGALLFLSSIFAMTGTEFWWFNSLTWPFLAQAYGLTATLVGAVWGLVIGLICGGICGIVIAGLYNWADKKLK